MNRGIVRRVFQMQPALQMFACASVVPGEDVSLSQPAEKHIFRVPASHTAQRAKGLDGSLIRQSHNALQIQLLIGNGLRQFDDGPAFGDAKSKRPQIARVQPG